MLQLLLFTTITINTSVESFIEYTAISHHQTFQIFQIKKIQKTD